MADPLHEHRWKGPMHKGTGIRFTRNTIMHGKYKGRKMVNNVVDWNHHDLWASMAKHYPAFQAKVYQFLSGRSGHTEASLSTLAHEYADKYDKEKSEYYAKAYPRRDHWKPPRKLNYRYEKPLRKGQSLDDVIQILRVGLRGPHGGKKKKTPGKFYKDLMKSPMENDSFWDEASKLAYKAEAPLRKAAALKRKYASEAPQRKRDAEYRKRAIYKAGADDRRKAALERLRKTEYAAGAGTRRQAALGRLGNSIYAVPESVWEEASKLLTDKQRRSALSKKIADSRVAALARKAAYEMEQAIKEAESFPMDIVHNDGLSSDQRFFNEMNGLNRPRVPKRMAETAMSGGQLNLHRAWKLMKPNVYETALAKRKADAAELADRDTLNAALELPGSLQDTVPVPVVEGSGRYYFRHR